MHRAAAVRRRDSDPAVQAGGPIDFLARLEALEKEDGQQPAEPPFQNSFSAPSFHKNAKTQTRPSVNDGGAAADQVIEQLRQMEQQLDDLRSRKRERTPPEKHVGGDL